MTITLPKTQHPLTHLTLPISKKKVSIRPMTIKEEKIILMAGEDKTDRVNALKQIVVNCVETPNFNVDRIPFVDFEYLFIMVRSVSIDNIATLQYETDDGKKETVNINLSSFKIKNEKNATNLIVKLTEKDCIKFTQPTVEVVLNITQNPNFDLINDLIIKCIDSIYLDQLVIERYSPEYNEDDVREFIEGLHSKVFREIVSKLFDKAPYLYYVVEVGGKEIEVTDFYDFF